jgi:hypothetical protein
LVSKEAAAKTGCNRLLTVIAQLSQTLTLLDFIDLHTPVPLKVQVAACCLAPAISILEHTLDIDSPYKKPIRWLYNNFGELAQVAVGIHALALLRLGFYTYGAVSLTFLAWGLLEKHHCLPLVARRVYEATIPWLSSLSLLFNGMALYKFVAAIELVDLAYPKVTALWARLFPKPKEVLPSLTYAQFEAIRAERCDFKVSRSHIEIEAFPQTAKRDFNKILRAWDAIDWSHSDSNLQRAVEADARWERSEAFIEYRKANGQEEGLQIMMAYAKKQLEALVKNIRDHTIKTGQPLNYAPLENYLGVIAEQLAHHDLDKRRQLLLQLALQGGQYCGPGIFTQLLQVATASLDATKALPFKNRVLIILQQERFEIVQAYHSLLEEMHLPAGKIAGGTADVHGMNYMVRLIAEDFHLPNTGASADEMIPLSFLDKWIFWKLLGINPECLWKNTEIRTPFSLRSPTNTIAGYTPERILQAIYFSKAKLPILTNDDFVAWARVWIEKRETGATEDQKANFLDSLEAGEFHQGTDIGNTLILATLVDTGILQIA